ncbi:HCP-like protein [Coemansia reversa NRRL 1564]|uniref:HCP-like protein n=1 Tax=Coemansia reversa (strain ATCC 12441 / NRRL 1564) TaxID=763665 RepID=A0A2G5BEM9_COERN|nr:HCP-like protein [Coemansia reversa NRRL 1564]|eukprot:PIA17470.1 HCP-like protein [Coemansia reversa NRRL 1564]
MVLTGSGYYDGQHTGQPAFRRTTGKVMMNGTDPNNPAIYQHSEQRQQPYYLADHQAQMQYGNGAANGSSHPYAHGAGNSTIPAPHDPQLQHFSHPPGSGYHQMQGPSPQQHQQQGGYYGSVAPPSMHPQRSHDSQRSQQHWQEQSSSQSYYQQTFNDTVHNGHNNGPGEDSDLNFGSDPSRQPPQYQGQLRPGSGQRTMADTAVRNSPYTKQRAYNANASDAVAQTGPMVAAFQQMTMGADGGSGYGRDGSTVPRQHMSSDAMRRREQALEDDYDRDDGLTGADIDVSLFPANAAQVANTMRADSYGHGPGSISSAAPPSSMRQAVHNKVLAVGAMHTSAMQSTPSYGSTTGSGTSTGASSPALGGRAYAADNGFDSSSDRIYANGQAITPQQHLHPDNMQAAGSYFVEPSAPPIHALYQPQAHGAPAPGSDHVYADSSDALPQPPPGVRPWTASSRSLPLAAPAPHFAERDGVSSSASSTVGVPPMGMHPSANTASSSPSKAAAPTPTAASLEAYRNSIKRSNDPAAQFDFAKYVLEHANGIAQNEANAKLAKKRYQMLADEGLKWVRKLAGSGITVHRTNVAAEAQFFLGTVHSRGIYGVPRDDAKAFSYYLQASKAQHAEANYRTAVCYEVGVGTRKDATRALQFYRKAAVQSNVPAMYKLGVILIKGLLGVSPTPKEGINWLKRGADNATPECPHSLHELALCHEAKDISGVIPDESYARQLYIKAGKLGYVPSQVRLGQAYEYGTLGCTVNAQKSVGWYTRAAEKNDPDAELALSGWYLTGAEPFLPQNDVEAYLWARRAADRGLAKAEYAVGYYYECGIGMARPDIKEAQKWYTKAAQKGNRRAIVRLKELKQMGVSAMPQSRVARPRRGKGSIF